MARFTELCLQFMIQDLKFTYLLIKFKENKGSDQLCFFCTYENCCLIWYCFIDIIFHLNIYNILNLHRNSKNMHFRSFFLTGAVGCFNKDALVHLNKFIVEMKKLKAEEDIYAALFTTCQ